MSYIPRRFAQQRMTFSDLEWPFHASRAISAVAELLLPYLSNFLLLHVTNRMHSSTVCLQGLLWPAWSA